jgi:hypothetical protein
VPNARILGAPFGRGGKSSCFFAAQRLCDIKTRTLLNPSGPAALRKEGYEEENEEGVPQQ